MYGGSGGGGGGDDITGRRVDMSQTKHKRYIRLMRDAGCPRKFDQAAYFEEVVAPIDLVVVFECPESVLVERLAGRGRADDDEETIKRRIETFNTTTAEVLEKYGTQEKVVKVESDGAKEVMFERLKEVFQDNGARLVSGEKDS